MTPNFHTTGIAMISSALLCDAIIGNVQERSMKRFNASNAEIVLYSYSIGFIYIMSVMLITGDFLEGLRFFLTVLFPKPHLSSFQLLLLLSIHLLFTGGFIFFKLVFSQNPRKMFGYAFVFSITGYLGIQIVLTLVRTCGAFAAVTVTTCRKAVTMVLSFIFFSKPFTFQ